MGASNGKPLPKTMKRLVIQEYAAELADLKVGVVEVDVPVPREGEVLVKVTACPVNPSDYGAFTRAPEDGSEAPLLGKEGSGVVVASGGGYMANSFVGKNVGFVCVNGGSYSEYAVVDAMKGCFALPADLAVEDACSFFVNPFTACGFVDTVKGLNATGFVHTAAASQLGQMLVKLCKTQNLTIINVVRREEQAQILRDLGAEHIVVSSEPGWKDTLTKKMQELKINVIFDAIAGDNTGDMVDCLPNNGTCFVYGGLSGKKCAGVHPLDLIYRKKKVEGWLLTRWIQDAGMMKAIFRVRWAAGLVLPALKKDGWAASQFDDATIDEMWPKFLEMWNGGGFTNKKLRVRMPGDAPALEDKKEEQ